MDFVGIVMFVIVLYVRPQEFVSLLESFRPALASMALAGVGLFTREGGVTLKQLIRTPMDWMMTAYFLYILFLTPGAIRDLWSVLYPSIGFYFLVALTLNGCRTLSTSATSAPLPRIGSTTTSWAPGISRSNSANRSLVFHVACKSSPCTRTPIVVLTPVASMSTRF